ARATVIVRARSGPNQGFACAPLTGLRVVATKSVGRAAMSEASNRGPTAAMPEQPPSASAAPTDATPLSAVRRETAVQTGGMRRSFTRGGTSGWEPEWCHAVWRAIAAITGRLTRNKCYRRYTKKSPTMTDAYARPPMTGEFHAARESWCGAPSAIGLSVGDGTAQQDARQQSSS